MAHTPPYNSHFACQACQLRVKVYKHSTSMYSEIDTLDATLQKKDFSIFMGFFFVFWIQNSKFD